MTNEEIILIIIYVAAGAALGIIINKLLMPMFEKAHEKNKYQVR